MADNTSLPIPYDPPKSASNESRSKNDPSKRITTRNKRASKQENTSLSAYWIISVSLCLFALLVISFSIISNQSSIFDPNTIISYVAEDFLGLDIKNGSIFDRWISDRYEEDTDKETDHEENDNNPTDDDKPQENDTEGLPNDKEDTELPQTPQTPLPDGEFPIIETDLSSTSVSVSNATSFDIDVNSFLSKTPTVPPYTLSINEDMTLDPLVLIIHTHGTEAYSQEGSDSYSENLNVPRSTSKEENVIAVGKEIAYVLNKNGIPTLHCEVMHDKDSYQKSYERASETIERYLERYPTIKYVFDVHRDSIINDSNVKFRPLTYINNEPTAQIMFVMGSSENTPVHKDWESNLTFALKLTESLNDKYLSFTRSLSLRASSYNQEYALGSLLVEIGSCGNTLSQAKSAGKIFAEEVSLLIKQGW